MTQAPGMTSFDTASIGDSFAVPSAPAPARQDASASTAYVTQPTWGQRSFESSETTRLNQAHWRGAEDVSVNTWLAQSLSTIRARTAYETRQNGTFLGVRNTHAEDIVGPSGPTLQVISDNDAYNTALEKTWRDWFSAPTPRPNVSGAAWLKLRIRSLWHNGEYLDQLVTDPKAEGPVKLRVRPTHPRRLVTPPNRTSDPNIFMGIRFDQLGCPAEYFLHNPAGVDGSGMGANLNPAAYRPVSPDGIIHEFIVEEEDQARGIPWFNTALQPSADLRDYDDQVMDAARQMADQSIILWAEGPDVPVWEIPEATTIERRTMKMAPPGWKPHVYPATQPPVQYTDFRAERQRDIGRPVGMPLLIVRLDASGHNYSSARLDTQGYDRAVAGLQHWISGDEHNYGTLNRLVDEVAKEARFGNSALRNRPKNVRYQWTWPRRPHVDVKKEGEGEAIGLQNMTVDLSDAVASRGKNIEDHIHKLKRTAKLLREAGLPVPADWIKASSTLIAQPETEDKKEPANAS